MEKKNIFKNSESLGYSFVKNNIIYVYLPFIYKTRIILILFKIVIFNDFHMLVTNKLNGKIDFFKTRTSLVPISMNIFFTIRIIVFLYTEKNTRNTKHKGYKQKIL